MSKLQRHQWVTNMVNRPLNSHVIKQVEQLAKIAKEMESGQRVVTLACDSGLKYLGGKIYT